MTQAQIAYWNMQETKRTNLANEAIRARANSIQEAEQLERARSNRAREAETFRSNYANESIGIANAVTGGVRNVLTGVGSLIPKSSSASAQSNNTFHDTFMKELDKINKEKKKNGNKN